MVVYHDPHRRGPQWVVKRGADQKPLAFSTREAAEAFRVAWLACQEHERRARAAPMSRRAQLRALVRRAVRR